MIPVAFDLRDPVRSGIARVASSMARAFVSSEGAHEFETFLCGPSDRVRALGLEQAARGPNHVVPWRAGRLDPSAELSWPRVSRAASRATWDFPHWDMPWIAEPRRAVVLLSDVIPLRVKGATSRSRAALAKRWMRWS